MGNVFEFQVALEHFPGVLPNHEFAKILKIGQTLQKQDALHQVIGVFHFINGLVVFVLCQFPESPVLIHLAVQEVLVDGNQLVVENFVEVFDDLWIAFHGVVPA